VDPPTITRINMTREIKIKFIAIIARRDPLTPLAKLEFNGNGTYPKNVHHQSFFIRRLFLGFNKNIGLMNKMENTPKNRRFTKIGVTKPDTISKKPNAPRNDSTQKINNAANMRKLALSIHPTI